MKIAHINANCIKNNFCSINSQFNAYPFESIKGQYVKYKTNTCVKSYYYSQEQH